MLTLKNTATENGQTRTEYECDFIVQCAGDSMWADTAGKQVRVTAITVIEEQDSDYKYISVQHDADSNIYTDTGFEAAIGNALGYDVEFTEEGMQEDGVASMEAYC